MGAFHDPPVPSKALAAVRAATCDARLDATPSALIPTPPMVIAFVRVQLPWPASCAAPSARAYGRDGVQRGSQPHAVVAVGSAQGDAERRAAPVHNEVALCARLAAVRRIWPRRRSPLFAGTEALSNAARLQSSCPAPSRRSSKVRCRAAQTPACCQSRNRRQQVIPDPHPISAGRYSQGRPVLSTNRMPVSTARSGTGGRPPLGRGRLGGSKGAISDQRSLGISSLAMHLTCVNRAPSSRFC